MWQSIVNFFWPVIAFFLSIYTCVASWFGVVPGVDIMKNYKYNTASSAQVMDIYLPKNANGNAILFIHGGGWTGGDKNSYADACEFLAQQGYACATMNYRLFEPNNPAQNLTFWDMTDDIAAAISKLDTEMKNKGITPKKLAINGASAGGHLTLLYAYARRSTSAIPIAFIAPDVGPSDFTDPAYLESPRAPATFYTLTSFILKQNVTADNRQSFTQELLALSPIQYIDAGAPPTLMRYGGKDELVPASNGTILAEKLNAAGVRNDLFIYENSGHGLENIKNAAGTDYAVNQAHSAKLTEYLEAYFD